MHRDAIDGSVRFARSTLERSMGRWIKVTMKIVGFAILAIAIVSGTEANSSAKSCTLGERIMKDCNTCICIDGFNYVCTTMDCVTGLTCRPGKYFKRYCNVCHCPSTGLAQSATCTKNVCLEGMFNEDGTLKGPFSDPIPRDKREVDWTAGTCEPGKNFQHYCNNCRCGTDGLVKSAACTKMACPEGMFSEDGTINEPPRGSAVARDKRQVTCEPGKTFKNYCNSCTCGTDGSVESAACTRMECVPGMWNEDGSLKQPLTDPTPRDKRQADGADATCVPGTSYNYYCNTCRCGTDGLRKTAMCTRAECPESMWNEDGSLKQPLTDPIPRDKRQADGDDATCVPGTSFTWYCNTCLCGDDGMRKSAGCTRKGCPEGVYNEDGTLKQPLSDPIPRDKRQVGTDTTCVPGTSFKLYCNTCHCPPNGLRNSAGCTLMGCQKGMWNEDGTLVNPDPTPRDKRQADGDDATCVPGTSFTWYCNTCLCGDDGMRKSAGCTRKGCPEGVYNEDGTLKQPLSDPIPRDKRQVGTDTTCVPGTSFKLYCNTCHCPPNGLRNSAGCTLMGCQEGMWNEDGTLVNPDPTPRDKRQADGDDATCVPGTSFTWYCNTCLCGDDGMRKSAGCTRKGCPEGVYNEDGTLKQPLSDPIPRDKRQVATDTTCVPGTSFKQYCNTCHCPPNGLRDSAVCTLIGCQEGMWNEDGTLVNPDPTPRYKRQADGDDATCVPGTSFRWYCNTCLCGDDGMRKSAGCTRKGCPEGVYNEDGTLKQPLSDPIPRDKRQVTGTIATCVPGTSFQLDCNTCLCPPNGLRDSAGCTLMGCLGDRWNEPGTLGNTDPTPRDKRQSDGAGATCVPGTSFKLFCNTCHCPANGMRDSAVCTSMACPAGMWNEDGSLKEPLSDPIPRDKRQVGGTDATCVPGTNFQLDCNTCLCPPNGLRASAGCTLMACSTGMWNEDGSIKEPLSDPIPREKRQADVAGATCVPGTSFSHYCNTCQCPSNGLRISAPCTLMACQEGMWNEDGTLANA